METETLPEMTIEIPGVFDTLTDAAGANVQEINLGTVWNEWNNNWTSIDVAGTEVTERTGQQRRNQWPFLRRPGETTTVKTQEVNNITRTGIRKTLQTGGIATNNTADSNNLNNNSSGNLGFACKLSNTFIPSYSIVLPLSISSRYLSKVFNLKASACF